MNALVGVLVAIVAAGCVTTKAVTRPVSAQAIADLNDAAADRDVTVETETPGHLPVVYRGSLFLEDGNGLHVADPEHGRQFIPIEDARRLRLNKHTRGALEGLAIGVAIGAVGGFLLWATASPGNPDACVNADFPCTNISDRDLAGYAWVTGTAAGAAVGAVVGAIIGHRFVYEF